MASLLNAFPLGWSHYIELMTLDDLGERRFYEIEASQAQWSVRELQRQIASSLYQRLALSRDKDQIRRLGTEQSIVFSGGSKATSAFSLSDMGGDGKPELCTLSPNGSTVSCFSSDSGYSTVLNVTFSQLGGTFL